MREVYIVISYTGTYVSKAIKLCTKNDYTHVSIALDKNLDELYSFGRIYSYTIAPAGFVQEGIDVGTFKRFKKTKVVIFSKEVTDEQYKKIESMIRQMEKEKGKYKFNYLGMFAVRLGKKIARTNYFYCAEFVKYILNKGGVDTSSLPNLTKPQDFMSLEGTELIYEGYLTGYSYKEKETA